jgi:3-oxoacyl-[acyl-carrier protein] reductase
MPTDDQTDRDLAGTVAFVTGASRGIGAATARLLGRRGAAVGVNYFRSAAPAKAVAEDIESSGGTAVTVQADVTSEEELKSAVDMVEEVLGPINVGIFSAHALDTPARAPFASVPQWLIEEVVLRQVRALLVPARVIIPGWPSAGAAQSSSSPPPRCCTRRSRCWPWPWARAPSMSG